MFNEWSHSRYLTPLLARVHGNVCYGPNRYTLLGTLKSGEKLFLMITERAALYLKQNKQHSTNVNIVNLIYYIKFPRGW